MGMVMTSRSALKEEETIQIKGTIIRTAKPTSRIVIMTFPGSWRWRMVSIGPSLVCFTLAAAFISGHLLNLPCCASTGPL